MEESPRYQCDSNEGLHAMLQRLLIDEGNPEVEIVHPTEGVMIVTQASYQETLEHLKKVANMSPAERLQETQKVARRKLIRFKTAMISAKVYTVDIDDDANFGKDIEGNDIDMKDMIFVSPKDYPPGIPQLDNELGCFADETMRKPPVRILTQEPPPLSA